MNPSDEPKGTVLIVDDHHLVRKTVRKLIERMGYRAEVAADGEQAVRAVHTGEFDLVLMDCNMPVMNGLEATAQIRQSASSRRLAIVGMTGVEEMFERDYFIKSGMDDIVCKPARPSHLERVLARWVGKANTP
jgi:CheY-like chemotaxis protein